MWTNFETNQPTSKKKLLENRQRIEQFVQLKFKKMFELMNFYLINCFRYRDKFIIYLQFVKSVMKLDESKRWDDSVDATCLLFSYT